MSSTQEFVAVIGGILAMVTGVVLTVVATLNYRLERARKDEASRSHLSAVHAADDLAHAVQSQWEDEESRRRIRDPFPLSVRWSTAPEELFDHWPNILQVPPGTLSAPLELADHLENILDTFDLIPSGRLVVLGKAGSGKTILAMRFVLNFLARRGEDDPVPVIFGLESWDPANVSLEEWIISRLTNDYPGLGVPASQESTIAAELVKTGRILPVLDGFDEIAQGLRLAALTALNATRSPLLLTGRLGEYAEAVDAATIMTGAAVIVLEDLTIEDLSEYLPRTTRKTRTESGRTATRWDPIITQLRHPSTTEEKMVDEVLSVPLMVGLARVIYSDSRHKDPSELLRSGMFATREALEEHLLDAFVSAVYQPRPAGHGSHSRREWSAADAQHWLENLALRLELFGTRDLAWWQLRDTISLPFRMLVAGLVGLIGGGLLLWPIWRSGVGLGLGFGFGIGLAVMREGRQPIRTTLRLSGRELRVIEFAISGATGGIIGGELGGLLVGSHGFAVKFLTGSVEGLGPVSVAGLIIGFAVGFAFAAVSSFRMVGAGLQPIRGQGRAPDWLVFPLKCGVIGFLSGFLGGVVLGLTGGLVLGTAGGLSAGLTVGLEAAVDVRAAPSPLGLLRADRANALFFLTLFGLTVGLSVGLVVWLTAGPVRGIMLGIGSGLVDGIGVALGYTGWGQWLVFTRGELVLTRRLPRTLPELLDRCPRAWCPPAGRCHLSVPARPPAGPPG